MSFSIMARNSNGRFISGTTVVNSMGSFVVKTIAGVIISQVAVIASGYLLNLAMKKAAKKAIESAPINNVIAL